MGGNADPLIDARKDFLLTLSGLLETPDLSVALKRNGLAIRLAHGPILTGLEPSVPHFAFLFWDRRKLKRVGQLFERERHDQIPTTTRRILR
jgi:hypothetical protein